MARLRLVEVEYKNNKKKQYSNIIQEKQYNFYITINK